MNKLGRKIMSITLCVGLILGLMPVFQVTTRAEIDYRDDGKTAIVDNDTDFKTALSNENVKKIIIAQDFDMTMYTFTSSFNREIIIDGLYNGEIHALSQNSENNMFLLQNTSRVTLQNLIINAGTSSGPIVIGHENCASYLIMDHVTVNCTAGNTSYGTGLHIYSSGATAEVNNCVFNGEGKTQKNLKYTITAAH
ncbi:MAG: hypothetical protein IJ079_04050 [Lachnospiraceae bacterium]|nr:hypothetical protein [Lachnospiraceae bacterium]